MNNSFVVHCPKKIISGEITLSGSKSISNRVLMIRALCDEKFEIFNLSDSDDSVSMDTLLRSDDELLDAHHAGTTFRFLTAYLAIQPGTQILTGSPRMKQRPIKALVDALNLLGADIEYLEEEGYPPLKINSPKGIWKSEISLPANISSQYITALLLIAPCLPQGLTIHLEGDIVSRPYIEMTLGIMAFFGVDVVFEGNTLLVPYKKYQPKTFHVEADWSAASYFYEIAAFSESACIKLNGLHKNSLQGDADVANICKKLGIETFYDEYSITLKKEKDTVFPQNLEYNFINVPDIAQSISVLCAGIGCNVLFSGLQTLKIKETDRISALKNEHAKMNVSFSKMPERFSSKTGIEYYMQEGMSTTDKSFVPSIDTYNDHRMAMCFAPLGLLFPIMINDPLVVSKSYPGFWKDISGLGFIISEEN
ncbi:MAG: 3-phosphoshikimate 1-carboxyvinyltransferase [Saprospiraceae bacterium]|jgi:3-phosphoshikimate 1-carboxyvinyltransferase|nr:3-phosphoshikimate 1-carboxyvinyltransferase [Saprospiraceae bacterium]